MNRWLVRTLLFLCLSQGLQSARADWKVATWNLQNFLVQNRVEAGEFKFSYPMPEVRKQRIRELILNHKPDLLFLQELGNEGFLLELQLDLKACGLEYPYYQFSGFKGARSGLAWLSKIPPSEWIFHDLSLRRGVQEIRFYGKSKSVCFYHVHLKSRFSEDTDDPHAKNFRAQEIFNLSDALRAFISVNPSMLSFLVGDFNTPVDDDLLMPLKVNWSPVPVADVNGNPFTYFHRSGSADILDGFWMSQSSDPAAFCGIISPLPEQCPSDHRFVILHLPSPS